MGLEQQIRVFQKEVAQREILKKQVSIEKLVNEFTNNLETLQR
jgi:hypothetical protein